MVQSNISKWVVILGTFIAALLIIWLSSARGQAPQPKYPRAVVNCVVVQITRSKIVVTCDTPSRLPACTRKDNANDPACLHLTYDIPKTEWAKSFPEWLYADTENWSNEPDKVPFPILRQLLKGAWVDSHFVAVPSCAKRTHDAITEYCGGHYCRPPINALRPEDCIAPQSEFVTKLLAGKE